MNFLNVQNSAPKRYYWIRESGRWIVGEMAHSRPDGWFYLPGRPGQYEIRAANIGAEIQQPGDQAEAAAA